jgi:hypothetical protein
MEASALNALADFRKVEMAQVFVISDSLAGGVWKPYFNKILVKDKLRLVAEGLVTMLS